MLFTSTSSSFSASSCRACALSLHFNASRALRIFSHTLLTLSAILAAKFRIPVIPSFAALLAAPSASRNASLASKRRISFSLVVPRRSRSSTCSTTPCSPRSTRATAGAT